MKKKKESCCDSSYKKGEGVKQALIYGLVPHLGCIAFIIASILGATALMGIFKPLLMNRYIFYVLILISIGFATLSSVLYLRKKKLLNWNGIKKKKGYLGTMYGLTIGINLLLFFVIFPLTANASIGGDLTGAVIANGNFNEILLEVDIPCPGHAPLISEELKTIEGVVSIDYGFPDKFTVIYDSAITDKLEILNLEVFDSYPANVLSESSLSSPEQVTTGTTPASSCGDSCGGGSSCGGSSCGGCGI